MKKQFLIRLDDACPTMDFSKWKAIENILDKHNIAPMVGIIPCCEDEKLMIDMEDYLFWEKTKQWQEKGWVIALHGYNHVYTSSVAGMNPLWNRSEFAGESLDVQKQKIRDGINIFKKHKLVAKCFFAPSHTYDLNTLEALRQESDIRLICDTIGLEVYRDHDFTFIPCNPGTFRNIPLNGIWTFCIHPNMMKEKQILYFDKFIGKYRKFFVSWDDIELKTIEKKSNKSKLISWLYFTIRKMRAIK